MKVTKFYEENHHKAGEWLKSNAPDYVYGVVEEMNWHFHDIANKYTALIERVEKASPTIESALILQRNMRERPVKTFLRHMLDKLYSK